METVLILAALGACAIAGVIVLALNARARRPPLRMGTDLHEDDENLLLASVAPPESPIDRSEAVLDLDPVDPRRGDRHTERSHRRQGDTP